MCLIEPVYYAFFDNQDSCSSSFFAGNLSHSDTKKKPVRTPIRSAKEDVISASVLCRYYRAKIGCRAIDVSFVRCSLRWSVQVGDDVTGLTRRYRIIVSVVTKPYLNVCYYLLTTEPAQQS